MDATVLFICAYSGHKGLKKKTDRNIHMLKVEHRFPKAMAITISLYPIASKLEEPCFLKYTVCSEFKVSSNCN